VERKKNIKKPIGYNRGVLEVEVEDIAKQKQSRPVWDGIEKADEPLSLFRFARQVPVTEMRIGHEKDLWGGNLQVVVHAGDTRGGISGGATRVNAVRLPRATRRGLEPVRRPIIFYQQRLGMATAILSFLNGFLGPGPLQIPPELLGWRFV
jgi:hypothetical protein